MKNQTKTNQSIGIFKMLGLAFNTVGTTVNAIDNAVSRTSGLLDIGFDAIEVPVSNMLADLECDTIVDDAKRDQRIAIAQAEALEIRNTLTPTPKKRGRPTKA